MIRLRGGSGLGDSIYLRPIVDYLVRVGNQVTVLSNYPDVFIDSGAKVEPFDKARGNMVAHYAAYRQDQKTTQFADMLTCAGIREQPVQLGFTWNIRNPALISNLQDEADGRPIIVVHGGRAPFGRSDGVGREILPRREAFEAVLGALDDCYTVRIGKGEQIYPLPASLDLCDETSVSDLLDIIRSCDGVVTQCGFPIPIAECFGKPVLAIWARRGLQSVQPVIPFVTPAKILSAPSSRYVIDDMSAEELAARAFWAMELFMVGAA